MPSPALAELRPHIFYFLYNNPKYQVNKGGATFPVEAGLSLVRSGQCEESRGSLVIKVLRVA